MFSLLTERGLPLPLMATYCAERPAQMHGLFPRKGAIAPGSDCDLVVMEPGAFRFDQEEIADREPMRWSPYHGRPMHARVAATRTAGRGHLRRVGGAGKAGHRPVRPACGRAMTQLLVRDATEDDLPEIVAMLADDHLGQARERPGDPAYRRAFLAMAAQTGNHLFVGTFREAGVVACAQLIFQPGLSRTGTIRATIEGVRVASAWRRRGLGEVLIRHCIARAQEGGAGWCSSPPTGRDGKRTASTSGLGSP